MNSPEVGDVAGAANAAAVAIFIAAAAVFSNVALVTCHLISRHLKSVNDEHATFPLPKFNAPRVVDTYRSLDIGVVPRRVSLSASCGSCNSFDGHEAIGSENGEMIGAATTHEERSLSRRAAGRRMGAALSTAATGMLAWPPPPAFALDMGKADIREADLQLRLALKALEQLELEVLAGDTDKIRQDLRKAPLTTIRLNGSNLSRMAAKESATSAGVAGGKGLTKSYQSLKADLEKFDALCQNGEKGKKLQDSFKAATAGLARFISDVESVPAFSAAFASSDL